jgi:hypothetical protein
MIPAALSAMTPGSQKGSPPHSTETRLRLDASGDPNRSPVHLENVEKLGREGNDGILHNRRPLR